MKTTLRLLAALLVVCAVTLAQSVSVANISAQRQARWCVAPMPASQADQLPDHAVVGGTWIATKGARLGNHTQLWHIRADLAGHAAGPLGDWAPWPAGVPFPAFGLSSWITDDLDKLIPRFTIAVAGRQPFQLVPSAVQLTEEGPAVRTWRATGSLRGWHMVVYAKTWSHQDAVDVRGYVVWSDPTVPDWSLPSVTVRLQTGEPLELHFATRNGFRKDPVSGAWDLLSSSPVPHGTAIPFRGVLLPTDDTDDPNGFSEWRRDMLEAARGGPIVAAADWRGAPWLAFGPVPTTSEKTSPEAFRSYLEQPGTVWDVRPLANGLSTGMTGAQACFGATKDIIALQGNPWRIWELMHSADDYLLRSRHHRESNGAPTTRSTHPQWQTWCGAINEHATDRLGKAASPAAGWANVPTSNGTRVCIVDDQHRGDGYSIACYALTGDEVLLEDLMDSIAVDEARAFPANGWVDAPRAAGRLWQSWAKIAVVVTELRARARALAVRELGDRRSRQPTGSPVHPDSIYNDPRILPGDAWVPWNESLMVLGALEQAACWDRLGDPELAAEFRAFAISQGRNNVEWGTLRTSYGVLLPLNGVLWQAGGAANPPDYYTWPRESGPPILMGSPGWWTWWAGALAATLEGPNDAVRERALEIWTANATGPQSREQLEWWGVR